MCVFPKRKRRRKKNKTGRRPAAVPRANHGNDQAAHPPAGNSHVENSYRSGSSGAWQQGVHPLEQSKPVPKGPGSLATAGSLKHALSQGAQPGAKHDPAKKSAQLHCTFGPKPSAKASWGKRSLMALQLEPEHRGRGL